jgi:anaphase-promoting complex subunit 5
MDVALPPTFHVLRPHHVGLLTIFLLVFKEDGRKKLPAPFILHVYRVLLNEVCEVRNTCNFNIRIAFHEFMTQITQPKSHQELIRELSTGQKAETEEPRNFIEGVNLAVSCLGHLLRPTAQLLLEHNELQTADQLTDFFTGSSYFVSRSSSSRITINSQQSQHSL